MISRRQFISRGGLTLAGGLELSSFIDACRLSADSFAGQVADIVVVGGGLGGCSAALAALRQGLSVVLTEPTDWLGGQLTSQGVPPDEHRWIETHGANASYRHLRTRIRDYYRRNYPLTQTARTDPLLNPGKGSVSRLCHEPQVALAAIMELLHPFMGSGKLRYLPQHVPVAADVAGDRVRAIEIRSLDTGRTTRLEAPYFVDATELGDLLPLTGTEHVIGNEGRGVTNEMHAPERSDPGNQQAFTCCFAMDHHPGENHVLERPENYTHWREYQPRLNPAWPGRWLDFTYTHPRSGQPKRLGFNPAEGPHGGVVNLWTYRRIAAVNQFVAGAYASDICLVNWPQNDYLEGPLVGPDQGEQAHHIASAKQLSLALLYWLQTEAPRFDGGTGFPGLRLRPDIMGTEDGMAKAPYVRESRRIKARFTVLESHCGKEQREQETGLTGEALRAARFDDSVGVGSYPIDLHPSTAGDNYIDFETLPFEVPLGALIPERMVNLLPANKNIGTTHVTNGCYRLHPVEWGIGEAVGSLVAYCRERNIVPSQVAEQPSELAAFQERLVAQGVALRWPES